MLHAGFADSNPYTDVVNFCHCLFCARHRRRGGLCHLLEDDQANDNHIPPYTRPNNHDSDTDNTDDASPSPHPHCLPPAKRVKRHIKDDVVSSSPLKHVPSIYTHTLVLLSTELLLPVVAKFQPGAYVDIVSLLNVSFCQCKTRRGLDRWVEYLEQLDTIFSAWYGIHGRSRIRHFHRCVPKGPTRAASVGNVTAMRRMYRFKLVLDDCIIAAVINGQFNVLQYLHAYESVNAFPKHCMQYAAACGHLGIVRFLDTYRLEADAVVRP
ncbi:hypothetical protein DYB30_007558 [Aphanomyces astaci]|uniref:Uncharacterized protein n=1 Tax=Aphanomyces astaci TaxID=112090 RepID=A0A397EAW7_APHAT|nr:hypothetical protein DYB30_007558 [Aphanomyces astaci]